MASNDIRGTVTDSSGNPVSGATVVAFEQDNITNIASTTTDSNGEYVIDSSLLTGDGPWHVTARWDDGSSQFNSLSKPYVSANLTGIPDSVVHQYTAEDFASPWPDNAGSADMTVNNLTASTFSTGDDSVSSDGVDDYGLAGGPQTLPENNQSFGVAFTAAWTNPDNIDAFFGSRDGNADFVIRDDETTTVQGSVGLLLRDNDGTGIRLSTDDAYDTGAPRAIIINVTGTAASDVEIYVDDMATEASTTTEEDAGFDASNYTNTQDMGFHAWNLDGSADFWMDMDSGVFEFWDTPLTQSDREDFVSRRPEVS